MSSKEFLERLDVLLKDIPGEEREEALRFYSEYFSEAGPFQEQAVLDELVSPEHVAAMIKKSLPGAEQEQCSFADAGEETFGQTTDAPEIPLPIYARKGTQENRNVSNQYGSEGRQEAPKPPFPAKTDRRSRNILIVLLAILSFPVWGSLAFAALAVAFSVVVCGAAFLFAGIVTIIASVIIVLLNLGAFFTAGLGTALLALGILLLAVAVGMGLFTAGWFILFWLVPAVWHVLKKFVIEPLRNRGAV